MSFVLRQITQRASGGEIARETRLESTAIDIGRGSDCAIMLADLAVMLRHARLSRSPSGAIVLQAMAGVPLNLGAEFADRFEIAAGQSAIVTLGSHVLQIEPGANSDETRITVERVAALFTANDPAAERRTFSLSGLLGKRRMAWAVLLAILAVGLFWPIGAFLLTRPVATTPANTVLHSRFNPDRLWSSGPLSRAHAGLGQNCRACHVAAGSPVADNACRACHVKLPDHAALPRLRAASPIPSGLVASGSSAVAHGLGVDNLRCASCHIEHEGPKQALRISDGFCRDCHAQLRTRLPGTRLANVEDFAAPGGHPEFNASLVIAAGLGHPIRHRQSLALPPRENSGLIFGHQQHLSVTNAVAQMAAATGLAKNGLSCGNCHVALQSGSWAPIRMEKNCATCHSLAFGTNGQKLPHGDTDKAIAALRTILRLAVVIPENPAGRRLPGVADAAARRPLPADAAVRALFAKGGACADCHRISAPADNSLLFIVQPVRINQRYLPRADFPHQPHIIAACTSCHAAPTSTQASDILIPGIATCRSCHVGVSVKNPARLPKHPASSACATCHSFHPKTTQGQFAKS